RMIARYEERLPLIDGAVDAVRRVGARWPLGLASSSNRQVIDRALELAGLAPLFSITVSSEEVDRGKPAPDVYLEAARRLEVESARCAAVEDSGNGIRSAADAGMRAIAIPNRLFPPPPDALALAAVVLPSFRDLIPDVVAGLGTVSPGRPSSSPVSYTFSSTCVVYPRLTLPTIRSYLMLLPLV